MSQVKVSVIYYSSTGTNHSMAWEAVRAAEQVGAAVRLRRVREIAPEEAVNQRPEWKALLEATRDIPEATLDDIDWADVIVLSTPTRFGLVSAQMKQFLDSTGPLWAQGKLTNKVVTFMTSAQNPHGGQEATLLSLFIVAAHWGAIIVPPGYTAPVIFESGGNPYGTSTVPRAEGLEEAVIRTIHHQVQRAIQVAAWLLKGREATR
ncbi:MAG: NAD(P)H dehydrogenase (quinone) [Fimbriimonadales bacterium]|nr:MAG: NAD(P)H dehydrogenase (quinone) [Fimbriimonadales bacterium]